MLRSPLAAAFAAALATGIAQSVAAQDAAEQRLGAVHFETSCNETAQRRFDRGMRYQHSFWYRASKEIFEDVLKADPDCAIAYWGIATSLLLNPFGVPPAANLAEGLAAIQKGKAHRRQDAARTRVYRRARRVLYRLRQDRSPHPGAGLSQGDGGGGATLSAGRRGANLLRHRARRCGLAQPTRPMPISSRRAAILEGIFKRQPQHPGVAHYLIHSLRLRRRSPRRASTPPTRYSQIAPTAPHAQHMPSHIFTRVGYWKESIALNAGSVRAAKADKEYGDQLAWSGLHGLCLSAARAGQERARGDRRDGGGNRPSIPTFRCEFRARGLARALRDGAWRLERRRGARGSPSKFAHVMAITHFARAVGAARSGKPDAAKADIAKLAELRDKLREAKDAYWAEQVDIQWQTANAWLLYARRQVRRGAQAAMSRRRRRRGQDREGAGDARVRSCRRASSMARCCSSAASPRTRSRPSKRRSRRSRTASAPRSARRGGGAAGRCRQGSAILCRRGRARRDRRAGPPEIAAARAFVAKAN